MPDLEAEEVAENKIVEEAGVVNNCAEVLEVELELELKLEKEVKKLRCGRARS